MPALNIKIDVDANAMAAPVKAMLEAMQGQGKKRANANGAKATTEYLRRYHAAYSRDNKWRGSRYLAGDRGQRSGDFGAEVARGWASQDIDDDGATLVNSATGFALKVEGGTIVPKTARALTIPLIPEAVGRRAKTYQQATGKRLFRPWKKGGKERANILAEATENGMRGVYALVKRVTIKPWQGAMPEPADSTFLGAFVDGYAETVIEAFEQA